MEGGAPRWDLLLQNALLFDGSGQPPRQADVAVADGRVVQIGTQLPAADALNCVDVAG